MMRAFGKPRAAAISPSALLGSPRSSTSICSPRGRSVRVNMLMAELLLVMCKIATMASRRQDGADDHPVSAGLTAAHDFKGRFRGNLPEWRENTQRISGLQ